MGLRSRAGMEALSAVFVLATVCLGDHAASASAASAPAPSGTWEMNAVVLDTHGYNDRQRGTRFSRTLRFRVCGVRCRRMNFETANGNFEATTVRRARGSRRWAGSRRFSRFCSDGGRSRGTGVIRFVVSRSVKRADGLVASELSGTFRSRSTGCGTTANEVWRFTASRTDLPPPPTPVADFSWEPSEDLSVSLSTNRVFFTDDSVDPDGKIVSRAWDFGDPASGVANTSQEKSPSHVFEHPGNYRVRLTVTDDDGRSATIAHVVTIAP